MFGSANKKEKLEKTYKKLLDESYRLSHTNRKKSDEKAAEAKSANNSKRWKRTKVSQFRTSLAFSNSF